MNKNVPARKGEFLIYQTENGQVKIDVRLEDETIWLSQRLMAELFQKDVRTINEHIQNIYKESELEPESTIRKFRIVQKEGSREVSREVDFYNLDMIISLGYRVKSLIATRFRIWATERLKEYIVKGFIMDDERLKNPPVAGSAIPDYFDEMLARIRDIRASERRMYLRVREIFAMAADYDPSWSETTKFFSFIQNKLHFAAKELDEDAVIRKFRITTYDGKRYNTKFYNLDAIIPGENITTEGYGYEDSDKPRKTRNSIGMKNV